MSSRIPFKRFLQKIMYEGLESFGRHYSSYRGIVIDNKDPKNYDRVFVYVPHISGKKEQGQWAWPKGKSYTNREVPKNGDMVWVEFERGDFRFPIWSFANQTASLGQATPHDPEAKVFRTEKGHSVSMSDREGVDNVSLSHRSGSYVNVTQGAITLKHKDGAIIHITKNHIAIEEYNGAKVLIKGGKISMNSGLNHGLIKIEELIEKLNNLERNFNEHIHVNQAGPTGTPQDATQAPIVITPTTKEELENPSVTH